MKRWRCDLWPVPTMLTDAEARAIVVRPMLEVAALADRERRYDLVARQVHRHREAERVAEQNHGALFRPGVPLWPGLPAREEWVPSIRDWPDE